MGTYEYMSPEQAMDSSSVDCRADMYSLACTLHMLLTGRPPYVTKPGMRRKRSPIARSRFRRSAQRGPKFPQPWTGSSRR